MDSETLLGYIMFMTREELIATVSKITELRSEVARLAGLQRELKRLEALVDEITGTPAAPLHRRGQESIEERAGRYLDDHKERAWSAEEVASALGVKVPTTRAAFSKLRKVGRIIDVARGKVQSAQGITRMFDSTDTGTEDKEESEADTKAAA
jgi:hypothetical protein